MAITPVPTMTAIPPFPALSDRATGTYNSKAYAFGSFMGTTFNGEFVAVANSTYANAVDANTSAGIAQSAVLAMNATAWVSGTTYAIGDTRYSPADFLTYRRKTAGAGTTDPSADTTNWKRVVYRAAPTAITIRTTSGTTVAPADVIGVRITAVGSGGGGSPTNAYQVGGGGGTAVVKTMAVTPGDSFVCVVGGNTTAGNTGNSTSISGAVTITAAGGGVGGATFCFPAGASVGGDLVIVGDLGHPGNNSTINGCGGRSHLGGGVLGGGGGGGWGGGGGPGSGVTSQPGIIIFEWIY